MVPAENDKPTVIALREIEEGFIDASILTQRDEPEYEIEAPMLNSSLHSSLSHEE